MKIILSEVLPIMFCFYDDTGILCNFPFAVSDLRWAPGTHYGQKALNQLRRPISTVTHAIYFSVIIALLCNEGSSVSHFYPGSVHRSGLNDK